MFPFHLTKTSAAFAALVLFSATTIAQTNSGARLSGRVYDALSLEPLIQAVVVVKSEGRPDQPVLSNLDGFLRH